MSTSYVTMITYILIPINSLKLFIVMIVTIVTMRPTVLIARIESFVMRRVFFIWIVGCCFCRSWRLILRVSWIKEALAALHLRWTSSWSAVVIVEIIVIAIWVSRIHITIKLWKYFHNLLEIHFKVKHFFTIWIDWKIRLLVWIDGVFNRAFISIFSSISFLFLLQQ